MLCKVKSKNGYGFLRPGLKMGVENGIFWSEIGFGFGDADGTPTPKILSSTFALYLQKGGDAPPPPYILGKAFNRYVSTVDRWVYKRWGGFLLQ